MKDAYAAEVIEVLGTSGVKGVRQVRCKLIEGPEAGKILIRNVVGPVRAKDILVLREIEMEVAMKLEQK
jgi:small subunit ribosomal protein S28e